MHFDCPGSILAPFLRRHFLELSQKTLWDAAVAQLVRNWDYLHVVGPEGPRFLSQLC